ncbi:MAG: hypothetical protein ABSE73_20920 [Planctomycetota bacterium]
MRVPEELCGSPEAQLVITFECKDVGKFTAAKSLAKLLREKPSLRALEHIAANLIEKHQDEAAALRTYEQALKLYPGETWVMGRMADLLLTASQKGLRDPKRALSLARQVARADKEWGWGSDILALALHENGELAEAVRYAKRAVELCRENPDPDFVKRAADYAKELEELEKRKKEGQAQP